MNIGYVRLHRKIMDTSFYKNPDATHLAMYLVMKANWRDTKSVVNGMEITVKRGECLTGRFKISEETGIKPSQVYKMLAILSRCHFCNIKSNNRFSVITIVKYNHFNPLTENVTAKGTTTEQPRSTSKEVKKPKKDPVLVNAYLEPIPTPPPTPPPPSPFKQDLDLLIEAYKQKSPIQCRSKNIVFKARDCFEIQLTKGKKAQDCLSAIEKAEKESLPWEIFKANAKENHVPTREEFEKELDLPPRKEKT